MSDLSDECFYPRCGFFSVATHQRLTFYQGLSVSIRDADFLALQRPYDGPHIARQWVSIRDADFLALQPGKINIYWTSGIGVSIRDADFLALQRGLPLRRSGAGSVSIRDADFLALQPHSQHVHGGCLPVSIRDADFLALQRFIIPSPRYPWGPVSIRDADFLALQLERLKSRPVGLWGSFYPRCGFFSVATIDDGQSSFYEMVSIRDADFLALQHAGATHAHN